MPLVYQRYLRDHLAISNFLLKAGGFPLGPQNVGHRSQDMVGDVGTCPAYPA